MSTSDGCAVNGSAGAVTVAAEKIRGRRWRVFIVGDEIAVEVPGTFAGRIRVPDFCQARRYFLISRYPGIGLSPDGKA
jgi:hypothetical protein